MSYKIISFPLIQVELFANRPVRDIFETEFKQWFIGGYHNINLSVIDLPKYLHILATLDFFDHLLNGQLEPVIALIDILQNDPDAQEEVRKKLALYSQEFSNQTPYEQACFKLGLIFHDIGYLTDPTSNHVYTSQSIFRELFSNRFEQPALNQIIAIIASHSFLAGIGVYTKPELMSVFSLPVFQYNRVLIDVLDSAKVFRQEEGYQTSIKLSPEIFDVMIQATPEAIENDQALYNLRLRTLFSSVHFGQLSSKNTQHLTQAIDKTLKQRKIDREKFVRFIANQLKIQPFFLPKDILVPTINKGESRFYEMSFKHLRYLVDLLVAFFLKQETIQSPNVVEFKLKDFSLYFKMSSHQRMEYRANLFSDLTIMSSHDLVEKYFTIDLK